MNIICTICARGGSKGVPDKNIRMIAGMPLILHTINQARDSKLFNIIAVSSDSDKILNVARQSQVDYFIKRPDELARDDSPKIPVIRHCVEKAEVLSKVTFDIVVDLDPTSPLRDTDDIRGCLELFGKKDASNVITAAPARRSPYFNLIEMDGLDAPRPVKDAHNKILCRQDAPKCFDMNASIYIWKRQALFNSDTVFNNDTALYIMPERRSVDIDSDLDFDVVEFLLNKKR